MNKVLNILEMVNEFIGPLNFLYTTILAIVTVKLDRKSKALKLVCKINQKNRITDKEQSMFGEHGIPIPVIVQNNSDSVFQKVFVIIVGDEREKHVKRSGKLLENLRISLELGHFGYMENFTNQEELLISSDGHGMHRRLGIVTIYEDEKRKEWIKDSDGKLYKTKRIEENLIKLGLPLPGYKSHVIYRC